MPHFGQRIGCHFIERVNCELSVPNAITYFQENHCLVENGMQRMNLAQNIT